METDLDRLIYDWNRDGRAARTDFRAVELDDETLRDGLQGPSVRNPPLEVKKRLLHLMDDLGIDTADIGLPGSSPQARAAIVALAKETTKLKRLRPNIAIRTHPDDVRAAIEASTEAGLAIESCTFIGSSPIRRFAEDWTIDAMLKSVETSVATLVKAGLPVMFVTEDTTRADPETLQKLYDTAIAAGAKRICVSDTCGHATPEGVRNLLTFVRDEIVRGRAVKIDYHGHNDRGLGTINALTATALADRVHGCALGIGERVGNSSMDQLLVNLWLWGLIDRDLTPLTEYTALADRVYSAVPASVFGREQRIEVGPMSGESNVVFWLERHGYAATRERIDRLLEAAKASDRLLTDAELARLAG